MRLRKILWINSVALTSFLLLASCAPPAAVMTASPDGDFRGSSTRYQVLQRTCPRPQLLLLHVQGNVTYYPWENQYIRVSVYSNGTISGALPGVQLTGTSDGTTMQGNITDGQCGLHFTVRRVGS